MAAVDVHSVAEINGVIKRDVMFTGSCTKAVMLQHNLVSHPLEKKRKKEKLPSLWRSAVHMPGSQQICKMLSRFFSVFHSAFLTTDGAVQMGSILILLNSDKC